MDAGSDGDDDAVSQVVRWVTKHPLGECADLLPNAISDMIVRTGKNDTEVDCCVM